MINLLNIFKKEYRTLNLIEVYKDKLIHNYKYLSSFKIEIAPVIKSNGYGHGIVSVAKILQDFNPPFFCVDSLFEAYELQKGGIKTPILITGYTNPQNLKVKKLPFSFAVYTLDVLEAINKYQPQSGIHIFIDTGMHREGVAIEDLPEFLGAIKQLSNIKVEGVMSHLASYGGRNDKLFLSQIKQFKKALQIVKKYEIKPKWIHIAATGSVVNPQTRSIILKISNMVRAGLSLYGISSSTKDQNLKPTMKLVTYLSQIKQIKKGDLIGYDGTYKAKKDTIIGVLPIGYYDGVDRGLSNIGVVRIDNIDCPIIGRVSMNLTTIDLSKVKDPKIGQTILVYSDNPEDKNSIEQVAKACKKIPYEILVNLSNSTKRVVI